MKQITLILLFSILLNANISSPISGETQVSINPIITFNFPSSTTFCKIEVGYRSSTFEPFFKATTTDIDSLIFNNSFNALDYNKEVIISATYSHNITEISTSSFTTINKPLILEPSNNQILADNKVHLKWISNKNLYEIQIAEAGSNFNNSLSEFLFNGNNDNHLNYTTFSVNNLLHEQSYEVRIRQIYSETQKSDWSDVIQFETPALSTQINPQLLNENFYVHYDPLTDSERDDEFERDISNTTEIGSTEGFLEITPTGAANYTIPIWCPPGRNGVKPEISFSYSSQSGMGLGGWGWHLNANSIISRSPKSKYYDGFNDEIKFDNTDNIVLNGMRLIPINNHTNGLDGAIYTTQNGNEIRIKQIGGDLNDPATYFVMLDKEGNKSYFGQEIDNSVSSNPTTYNSKEFIEDLRDNYEQKILSWKLNKFEDKFGNYIEYIYENSISNSHVLKLINYTKNNSQDPNTNPFASIIINYKQKATSVYQDDIKDQFEKYTNGFLSKSVLIVDDIRVIYDQNEKRMYKFNYVYSNGKVSTMLASLQEFGIEPENELIERKKLNKTVFKYYEDRYDTYNMNIKDDGVFQEDSYNYFGDFNGDGIQDRMSLILGNTYRNYSAYKCVIAYGSYKRCNKNSQTNDCNDEYEYTFNSIKPNGLQFGYEHFYADNSISSVAPLRIATELVSIVDINQDGYDDVIIPEYTNSQNPTIINSMNPHIYESMSLKVYLSDENGNLQAEKKYNNVISRRKQLAGGVNQYLFSENFVMGDYDGDGSLELIIDSEVFHTNDPNPNPIRREYSLVELVDQNNNLLNATNTQIINVNNTDPNFRIDHNETLSNFNTYNDGKTRLLLNSMKYFNNTSAEYFYILELNEDFNGNRHFTIKKSFNSNFALKSRPIIADFNADGYSDILYQTHDDVYITFWDGDDFTSPIEPKGLDQDFFNNYTNIPMDFNGDGLIDIFSFSNLYYPLGNDIHSRYVQKVLIYYYKGLGKFEKKHLYSADATLNNISGLNFTPPVNNFSTKEFILRSHEPTKFNAWEIGKPSNIISNFGFVDFNRDGNIDIFNPSIGSDVGNFILINANDHGRVLESIEDGLGNKTVIQYFPYEGGSPNIAEDPDNLRPFKGDIWLAKRVKKYKNDKNSLLHALPHYDSDILINYDYGEPYFHKELGFFRI